MDPGVFDLCGYGDAIDNRFNLRSSIFVRITAIGKGLTRMGCLSDKALDDPNLHRSLDVMEFPASRIFENHPLCRVQDILRIQVTDHTYLPKSESFRSDWIAVAALPAYRALLQEDVRRTIDCYCAIGTGAGIDALAAIEVFEPRSVVITDLHGDVVETAHKNIERNLLKSCNVEVLGCVGALADPLDKCNLKFDVIYENLPNIPIDQSNSLYDGRTSSSFSNPPTRKRPVTVRRNLLDLHYDLLRDVRNILTDDGCVLSVIGSRMPVKEVLELPLLAGYEAALLTYTWKIQSEASEVIPGYLASEQIGHGPFHYYPVEALEKIFGKTSPTTAARNAAEIEAELQPHAISSEEAWNLVTSGHMVGHTVMVLKATLQR